MKTADLSDKYPDLRVCEPIFQSYGANPVFGGPIRTIQCFEDFSRVRELVEEKSDGGVLVVDAGGSMRCAMLGDMLARIDGKWMLKRLSHISPLAVPLLMELGKEPVRGTADDELLGEASLRAATRHEELIREATQSVADEQAI